MSIINQTTCDFTVYITPWAIWAVLGGLVALLANIMILAAIHIATELSNKCHQLLANLAVADLLSSSAFLICGSLILFGRNSCAAQSFTQFQCFLLLWPFIVSFNTGAIMILVVGLDRYVCIRHPVLYHNWQHQQHVYTAAIVVSWIYGFLFLPMAGQNAWNNGDRILPTCVLPTVLQGYPMEIWAQTNVIICVITTALYASTFYSARRLKQRASGDENTRLREGTTIQLEMSALQSLALPPKAIDVLGVSPSQVHLGGRKAIGETHNTLLTATSPVAATEVSTPAYCSSLRPSASSSLTHVGSSNRKQSNRLLTNERLRLQKITEQLFRSIILVGCVFVLCWFASCLAVFLVSNVLLCTPSQLFHVSLYVGVLANINVGCNAFIYYARSEQFRMAYSLVFKRIATLCRHGFKQTTTTTPTIATPTTTHKHTCSAEQTKNSEHKCTVQHFITYSPSPPPSDSCDVFL